jgi:ATP-dependent DNA ligase
MAFDLLHLNGRDLRQLPLIDRRQALCDLLGPNDPGSSIQYSDHMDGDPTPLLDLACDLNLEGIVSKRRSSLYPSGRTRSWLKTKCFDEAEFVVIGTAKGERAPVALLAREAARGLEYAGSAFVTLADPDRDRFWRASEELKIARPSIPMPPRKETGWMRPVMRVRARFLRGEEMLRHATVKAII